MSQSTSLLFRAKLPIGFVACIVVVLVQCATFTKSEFTPHFVWSAVNKSLEEDRLLVVDKNSEKVRIKGCVRVVLYNRGSERFTWTNHSGEGFLFVDATYPNFSTPEVVANVTERIDQINQGVCVPCIVIISLVNVSANPEERKYRDTMGGMKDPDPAQVRKYEAPFQDYKLALSQQLTLLLQYKTPIPARHLILVRLVEKTNELTKCHGKKYTRYPRRLVSIWEQVLFDHFREARVIQGATEYDPAGNMLFSGKETGIWVWMCEEIIARLELQEQCDLKDGLIEKEQCLNKLANVTTGLVDMSSKAECKMYRART